MIKKTFTAIAMVAITTSSAFAADFLTVTKMTVNQNGSTTVTFNRTNVTGNHEQDMMTFSNTYKGTLTAQEAVNKGSLISSEYVTVRSRIGNTQVKQGQVNSLAKARSDAFQKDGYRGYFAELAKQVSEENLF